MSENAEYTVHTDGGARGNPGPAAFAYVIETPDKRTLEEKGYLGHTTNNIAEYTGLVRALEHAERLGARRLRVHSDSELMVKQMNGEYKVKNEGLRPLFEQADKLRRGFDQVRFQHVRREHNKHADRLCNEAMDAALGVSAKPAAASRKSAAAAVSTASLEERVREDAMECLQAAARTWSKGNPEQPPPEMVWQQLWSILEEGAVLRKK